MKTYQLNILFFIVLWSGVSKIYSQIAYTPLMLIPDKLRVTDIFTGNIQNSGQEDKIVYLRGKVFKEGKMVATVTSSELALNANTRLTLNQTNALQGVQVQYYDREVEQMIRQVGYFAGQAYEICVEVMERGRNAPLSNESCRIYNSRVVFPPILIRPTQQITLNVQYPLFVWSFNQNLLSDDYTLILRIKELLPDQSEVNAMESNLIFYEVDVSGLQLYQYPLAARALENCTQYVWQLIVYENKVIEENKTYVDTKARNTKRVVTQSEIESFRTPCNTNNPIAKTMSVPEVFYVLQQNLNEEYHTTQGGKICFKYENSYNSDTLNYKIYNWKREEQPKGTLTHFSHYYKISTGLTTDELYVLEVEDAKKQVYKMKFIYKQ